MKVVIVEDEHIAAQRLIHMLADLAPEAQVAAQLQSIEESVEFFQTSPKVDLVFMDIHLADGAAFRIFDQVRVESPIIFTTAYDQYALKAFKVNSIDYLLKPINPDDLRHALEKYRNLSANAPLQQLEQLQPLIEQMMNRHKSYPAYLLIPHADKLTPVAVSDIACAYLDNKVTHIVMLDGSKYALDKTLEALEEQLDPSTFYRANRQYIVAHQAITEISLWLIGKLKLTLSVSTPDAIIIPKAKVPEFKQWFAQ